MRLRCSEILDDYFITRLLRSLLVNEFWKSVDILVLPKLWARVWCRVFWLTTLIQQCMLN